MSRTVNGRPEAPRALAIPDMHDRLLPVIDQQIESIGESAPHVLDLGAGEGAFSHLLQERGYRVAACDLYPEMFRCPGVECRRADVHDELPYQDATFDAVISIEVVEHLESQLGLFEEVGRVLKPGGQFIFTTPNIASLKSRLGFLFSGYFYSHGPLDPEVHDPVSQHIAAFTPDRYRFVLARAGLELENVETDKYQKTSLWLSWLAPLIWCHSRRKYGRADGPRFENSAATLFGRTMIGMARKSEVQQVRAA